MAESGNWEAGGEKWRQEKSGKAIQFKTPAEE